jgi:cyclase
MSNLRIIPRIDIKNDKLIKTIRLEGVKPIGDPKKFAKKYYDDGADEIFINDAVASLYNRNSLFDIIKEIAKEIFVPITVAGGIRSLKDVERILKSGADKVALNTQLHDTPKLINEISKNFGSQCMVLQIDAKRIDQNKWEPYTNGGRDRTYKDLFKWVQEAQDRGAGEIFLTAIDHEGTKCGAAIELIKKIKSYIKIPIIISGGIGNINHVTTLGKLDICDGIALSYLLHIENFSIKKIKEILKKNNVNVSIR